MQRTFTLVQRLIHTSADDCRSTLHLINNPADLPHLEEALELATKLGYKTKATHIGRKIREIKKAAA